MGAMKIEGGNSEGSGASESDGVVKSEKTPTGSVRSSAGLLVQRPDVWKKEGRVKVLSLAETIELEQQRKQQQQEQKVREAERRLAESIRPKGEHVTAFREDREGYRTNLNESDADSDDEDEDFDADSDGWESE
ncbi:hypothetical protein HDV00_007245 [Rhizophlyctis rosea]|nr:hypothetical protein HDV00_007245 [Rhizophlyctis rosea]